MPNFTEGLEILPYLDVNLVPRIAIRTSAGDLYFHMYGEYTEFRVRTTLTKEPETIQWIESMKPGEHFWDIGANIGVYSCFAGLRGVLVSAFEPSPTNFWLLNQNVQINRLSRVRCLPVAVAGNTGLVGFTVDLTPAAAGVNQVNGLADGLQTQSYCLDDLVQMGGLKTPNHLKVDVDGIELIILRGGTSILHSEELSSVMCEVDESDSETTNQIHDLFRAAGFSSVTTRHAPYFDDNYYLPRANHLFRRI
ncbi:MAG: FkbM family methyltransferase [Actinobacteria bacterium]|nr:FkbM family methyltransferase [Actinomycetota bacterium]NBP17318.1 FkbM family methyltransferase [Actinomycetota bacterium]